MQQNHKYTHTFKKTSQVIQIISYFFRKCLLIFFFLSMIIRPVHAGFSSQAYSAATAHGVKSHTFGYDFLSGTINHQEQDIIGALPYTRIYQGHVRSNIEWSLNYHDHNISAAGWTDNYDNYVAFQITSNGTRIYRIRLPGSIKTDYFALRPSGVWVRFYSSSVREASLSSKGVFTKTDLGEYQIQKRGEKLTITKNNIIYQTNTLPRQNGTGKLLRIIRKDNLATGQTLIFNYHESLLMKSVKDNRNNTLTFERKYNGNPLSNQTDKEKTVITKVIFQGGSIGNQQTVNYKYTPYRSLNMILGEDVVYMLTSKDSQLNGKKTFGYKRVMQPWVNAFLASKKYNVNSFGSLKERLKAPVLTQVRDQKNTIIKQIDITQNYSFDFTHRRYSKAQVTIRGYVPFGRSSVLDSKTLYDDITGETKLTDYKPNGTDNISVEATASIQEQNKDINGFKYIDDSQATYTLVSTSNFPVLTINNKPIKSFVHDSYYNRLVSYVDMRGYKTQLTYDTLNRIISVTEAAGTLRQRQTTYTYSTLRNGKPNLTKIPNTITKPNFTVINELNFRGQITKQTKKSSLPESQDQVVSYAYHEDKKRADYGLLYKYDGPRTDINDKKYYHYDKYGNLKQEHMVVSKPRDNTVTNYYQDYRDYNSAGKPRLIQGFDGVWTEYQYDASGTRTTQTVVGTLKDDHVVGRKTRAEYDDLGRLQYAFDAYGAKTEYVYDSIGRIKKQVNPDNSFETYEYFANNTLKAMKAYDAQGRLAREQWQGLDVNGRIRWTREGADANERWTQFDYDANGNIKEVRQPEGITETYSYDAHNRKVSFTDGEGDITTYDYDLSDNLKSQKAANGTGDDTNFTQTSNPRERWNSDAGYKKHVYNNAGQLTTQQHAGYRQCNMLNIDSYGRMATQDCFDPTQQSYGFEDLKVVYDYNYDVQGFGKLNSVTYNYKAWNGHPQGVDTFYSYNLYGDITEKRQDIHTAKHFWQGATTQMAVNYDYNDNGLQTSLTTPKGNRVDYIYDNNRARLVGVNLNGNPLITNIDIDGAGRLRGWKWANHNAFYYRDINNQNEITKVSNTGLNELLDWRYQYDGVGRLRQFDGFGTRIYDYDKKSQLKKEDFVGWGADVYHYDKNGNRKTKEVTQPGKYFNISYDYTNNRLNRINNETIQTHGAGEIIGLKGHMKHAAYDYMGRKRRDYGVDCTSPQNKKYTCAMWYDYSHKNERVFRFGAWLDRQYLYDENSRLIGEYQGYNQDLIAEYIWLGDIPLAAIVKDQKNGQTRVLYIATDRKNTPVRIYDSVTKDIMWSWTPTAFGESTPWVRENRVEINLRLPGQYYDEHTKLHYNHHRYYAPQLGRYVEPDPIGLEGGMNPYAYAGNDPVNNTDSTGLYIDPVTYMHIPETIPDFSFNPALDFNQNMLNQSIDSTLNSTAPSFQSSYNNINLTSNQCGAICPLIRMDDNASSPRTVLYSREYNSLSFRDEILSIDSAYPSIVGPVSPDWMLRTSYFGVSTFPKVAEVGYVWQKWTWNMVNGNHPSTNIDAPENINAPRAASLWLRQGIPLRDIFKPTVKQCNGCRK